MDRTGSRPSRRQFARGASVAGLGLLAGCASPVSPPPATKVHRVIYLAAVPSNAQNTALGSAFRQGLRDLGYVEGQQAFSPPWCREQRRRPAALPHRLACSYQEGQ